MTNHDKKKHDKFINLGVHDVFIVCETEINQRERERERERRAPVRKKDRQKMIQRRLRLWRRTLQSLQQLEKINEKENVKNSLYQKDDKT